MTGKTLCAAVHKHEQTVESSEWVIQHGLGGSGGLGIPIVDVYVELNGSMEKMIPQDVLIVDSNTVTVYHSIPRTGIAVVVV